MYYYYYYVSIFRSVDETTTESILKAIQSYSSVSGQFDFMSKRDAFVSCICQAAIPTSYLLALKSDGSSNHSGSQTNTGSSSSMTQLSNHSNNAAASNSGNGNREVSLKVIDQSMINYILL